MLIFQISDIKADDVIRRELIRSKKKDNSEREDNGKLYKAKHEVNLRRRPKRKGLVELWRASIQENQKGKQVMQVQGTR